MSDRFIKLVRDRVSNDNDQVVYKPIAGGDDVFYNALKRKLLEEALEYQENSSWSELIDVFEVILALCEFHGKGFGHLQIDAHRRQLVRGSFRDKIGLWIRRH